MKYIINIYKNKKKSSNLVRGRGNYIETAQQMRSYF